MSPEQSLLDVVQKWMDTQKITKKPMNVNQPTPEIINLTWLLQCLGFNIDELSFANPATPPKSTAVGGTVILEMSCSISGLRATLSRKMQKCECPPKTEGFITEITSQSAQGTAKQASSSLMPVVSRDCAMAAKAILPQLFTMYQESMLSAEALSGEHLAPAFDPSLVALDAKLAEVLAKPKVPTRNRSKSPKSVIHSNTFELPNAEGASNRPRVNTPRPQMPAKSSGMQDFKAPQRVPRTFYGSAEKNKMLEIPAAVKNETKTENSTDDIPDIPRNDPPLPSASKKTISPMNLSYISGEGQNITSTPNKVSLKDRDDSIVKALNDARKNIDQALMYVKCNITSDVREMQLLEQPKTITRSNTYGTIQMNKPAVGISARRSIGFGVPSTIASPIQRSKSNLGPTTPRPKTEIPVPKASSQSSGPTVSKKSQKLAAKAPSLLERYQKQKELTPVVKKKY